MPKSLGLVVDGPFDEEAHAALLRKLRPGIAIVSRVAGRNLRKAVAILTVDPKLRTCDGVIWVTDAETDNPSQYLKRMRSEVQKAGLGSRTKCVVAVRMLEAWLLADDQALKDVAGIHAVFLNPENVPDPKRKLRRLLAAKNKTYTAQQARRIAEAADPATLVSRCPSFVQFKKAAQKI